MIEPTGYTALDLIGFTDRGAYDPTATYVKNDIVTVGNTKWRCKVDDTTGVTPAENANWTIYLESATSLAGMDDVNITTPEDGDLLQYNGANSKWENSHDVWDTMTQNGAHNWFNLTASTQTVNGATFTMNSNGRGTITISGKHTYANAQSIVLGYVWNVKGGYSFIFNGIENAFTSASIDLRFYNSNDESLGYTTYWSGDLSITAPANTSYIKVTIYFNNQDFGVGVTIYPMLRLATDPDPTFAPYAKTNRELTEVKTLTGISATSTAYSLEYASVTQVGNIVQVSFSVKITSNLSAGGNADGTLTGLPLPLADCQGDTYTGTKTVGWLLQSNGLLRIRAIDALSANEYVAFGATYICK